MKYFFYTTETIPDGLGWSHYDATHLFWLGVLLVTAIGCSWLYRKSGTVVRRRMQLIFAALTVGNELMKMIILPIAGNYTVEYLPLHLCSINIIIIAIHVFKPSKLLDNFLYVVCIPGALAAMLFPTWTSLPTGCFMQLHSFTVHITLVTYPLMMTVGGDIKPDLKMLPKLLLMLVGMAIPVYILNLLLDTNFMFLMKADPGNPLYLFEQLWGNHLYGFPVLITAVLAVMYTPILIINRRKKATVC